MSDWQVKTIGELCDVGAASIQTGPFGSQLHSHDYVQLGIPVIPTSAIAQRGIDHSQVVFIAAEKAKELDRHTVRTGDILFARRGAQATGSSVLVTPDEVGWICGTGVIRLRFFTEEIIPEYIAIYLSSPQIVEWIRFHALGTTMPNLNQGIIRQLTLPIPELPEQRAIAHILDSLDDKIELNRHMNTTLEATARALFKSWFVDFDPVHYKLRGEQPPGMDAETAALFPDSFEDSELGLIPAGWKIISTENFCQSVRDGTHNSPKPQDTGRYLITSRHIIGSEVDLSNAYRISNTDFEEINRRSRVDHWDVLITMIGTVGESFLVREKPDFAIKNIGLFKSKDRVSGEWLYLYLTTANTKQLLKSLQSGTTQAYISLGQLRQIPLIAPSEKILDAFGEAIVGISDKITHNLIENRLLAETRDALLPKLVSGELRVAEIDNEITETT